MSINSEFGFVEDVSAYWDKWYNFTKHMGITSANDPVAQQWNAITNEVTGDVWGYNNSMTNPLTSPLQRGPFSNTTLSVSGGGQDVQYFVSGRWNDAQGPYPVNNLQQGSMRANVTARTSEAFEVSLNTNYIESDIQFPESSRSFRGYSTNSGAGAPINSFGVRPDGSRGDCLGTLVNGASPSTCELRQGNLISNFDNLNTVFGGQKTGRFVGSATLRWSPLSWLTNRAVVGVDHSQMKDINEFPLDENRPFGVLSAGYLRDQRTTDINRTFEYTGTVTADVTPDLASTTTAGGSVLRAARGTGGLHRGRRLRQPDGDRLRRGADQDGFLQPGRAGRGGRLCAAALRLPGLPVRDRRNPLRRQQRVRRRAGRNLVTQPETPPRS